MLSCSRKRWIEIEPPTVGGGWNSVSLAVPKAEAAIRFVSWSLFLAILVSLSVPLTCLAQAPSSYGVRVIATPGNLTGPTEVVVDGKGNLYIADQFSQEIDEFIAVNGVIPTNPVVRTLAAGLSGNGLVAVDKAGNVFTNSYLATGSSIVEILAVNGSIPNNPTVRTLISFTGDLQISSMTADGQGNLDYTIDQGGSVALLQLVAINGSMPANPVSRNLFSPLNPQSLGQVIGDGLGNAYYIYFDLHTTSLYKLTAVNGVIPDNPTPQPLLNLDAVTADLFSVDPKGNVFLNLQEADKVAIGEVVAVNGTVPENGAITKLYEAERTAFAPFYLAVDANDNIFTTNHNADDDTTPAQVIELSQAGVMLTPSTYDYGPVDLSSNASKTFTLANTGTSSITIASTSLASSVFTIAGTTCQNTLAAGADCTYDIEFAPSTAGTQSATFSVIDDGGTQSATLTGTGAALTPPTAPQAALTPSTQDFGSETIGSSSAAKTFTLANAGTATLPITSVTITGSNASSFTIGTNSCGATLAAGASCSISISFKPGAVGSDSASLNMVDSVGTQTSALTGTGIAAAVMQDFALAATPATQIIAAGDTANYTVNITPSGGFDSAVALKATGLPPGATVTFSPASVTPGGGVASSSMAIHVASLATVGSVQNNTPWKLGAPLMAAVFLFIPMRRMRMGRGMLCALVFSTTLFMIVGCGGGFGYGTKNVSPATYTVTVTGTSGSLTHSTTVQLTVQSVSQAAE